MRELQDWIVDHKNNGIQPVFANPSRSVVRQMENANLPDLIGREFIAVRMHDAIRICQVRRTACPSVILVPLEVLSGWTLSHWLALQEILLEKGRIDRSESKDR